MSDLFITKGMSPCGLKCHNIFMTFWLNRCIKTVVLFDKNVVSIYLSWVLTFIFSSSSKGWPGALFNKSTAWWERVLCFKNPYTWNKVFIIQLFKNLKWYPYTICVYKQLVKFPFVKGYSFFEIPMITNFNLCVLMS